MSRFRLVDVLKLDVVGGLGLHVWEGAWKGEDVLGGVKDGNCMGDEPEGGGLLSRTLGGRVDGPKGGRTHVLVYLFLLCGFQDFA